MLRRYYWCCWCCCRSMHRGLAGCRRERTPSGKMSPRRRACSPRACEPTRKITHSWRGGGEMGLVLFYLSYLFFFFLFLFWASILRSSVIERFVVCFCVRHAAPYGVTWLFCRNNQNNSKNIRCGTWSRTSSEVFTEEAQGERRYCKSARPAAGWLRLCAGRVGGEGGMLFISSSLDWLTIVSVLLPSCVDCHADSRWHVFVARVNWEGVPGVRVRFGTLDRGCVCFWRMKEAFFVASVAVSVICHRLHVVRANERGAGGGACCLLVASVVFFNPVGGFTEQMAFHVVAF